MEHSQQQTQSEDDPTVCAHDSPTTRACINVKRLEGTPIVISLSEDPLGRGTFGVVRKGYSIENENLELAVKVIENRFSPAIVETIQQEMAMLETLEYNPNLVNYLKVKLQSDRFSYICMEYCNEGSLQQFVNAHDGELSEGEILDVFVQFVNGYRELYGKRIVHRDIKMENILRHNGIYKIADFGLAKVLTEQTGNDISVAGTLQTCAPEILLHKNKILDSRNDVFSFGVVVFLLMYKTRVHPYLYDNAKCDRFVDEFRQNTEVIFPDEPPRRVELKDLVRRMLEKDIQKRISWDEIFAHPLLALSRETQESYERLSHELVRRSKRFAAERESVRRFNFLETSCLRSAATSTSAVSNLMLSSSSLLL